MNKRDFSICAAALCCALATSACGDDDGDDGTPMAGAGGVIGGGSGGTSAGAGGAGGRSGAGGTAGSSGTTAGGSGGTSGAGGSAGGAGVAGDDGDAGVVDEDAGSPPDLTEGQARAMIAPFGAGTVTGTVTFTQVGLMVTVVVELQNCPAGAHPVHIHQGTSCADANAQGMHWDTTRGEGIPDVTCANNTGTVTHTRAGTPGSTAWSVNGSTTTNVIGHAFVVHTGQDRIGCGVIAGP